MKRDGIANVSKTKMTMLLFLIKSDMKPPIIPPIIPPTSYQIDISSATSSFQPKAFDK